MRRVLVFIAAAAALLVGWYVMRGSRERTPASAAPPAAGQSAATNPGSGASGVQTPAPGVADPSGSKDTGAPPANSSKSPAPNPARPAAKANDAGTTTSGAAFRELHKNSTRSELQALTNTLSQRISEERKRLIQERFARGQFVVARPGEPAPDIPTNSAGVAAESDGTTMTSPTGASEAHVAWLPFDEYPDFYASLADLAWLKQQLK